MTQTEPIEVETDTVRCDGGGDGLGDPLGHPMVSLKIVRKEGAEVASVVCPYCSRHFVLKRGASVAANH